jgi:hypothetical protein
MTFHKEKAACAEVWKQKIRERKKHMREGR